MKKIIFLIYSITNSSYVFSQGRLVLNNNPFLVIENNAQLIIDNSSSNAITLVGSGGYIVSEGENNKIKWNIGTATGLYNVPVSTKPGNKIPIILDVTTAGISNGSVLFSTYSGITWDNSTFLPSDVTSISSSCCSNNSSNVIDRFWIIDPINYTTKPTVSITFTYLDSEHSNASNTIDETTLFAQRFNPNPINDWGDWLAEFGTTNINNNTVSTGSISPSNFFRSWTLVNQINPLPIELLYFKGGCDGNKHLFEWATATENNNDFFTIEASLDAVSWNTLKIISATGNSYVTKTYSYKDNVENKSVYYRLKQTDYNNKFSYSNIISIECNTTTKEVNEYPNPNNGNFVVNINGYKNSNEAIILTLTDVISKLIDERTVNVSEQNHQEKYTLNNLKQGIYFLTIKNSNNSIVKKIIINN